MQLIMYFTRTEDGEELRHDKRGDFDGYIEETEVAESSSSSNVVRNNYCCKKDETEKLLSAVRGREGKGQAHKYLE